MQYCNPSRLPAFQHYPNFANYEGHWEYTVDSKIICYTVRFRDRERDKPYKTGKSYRPWSNVGGIWQARLPEGIQYKPIYNYDALAANLEAPVLIVEGEKAADAGSLYFPDFVTVTWLGGSAAAAKIDFSVFAGRSVYLLPDFDEPGYKAMRTIKEALTDIAANVYLVDIKSLGHLLPAGWDLADFEEGQITFDELIMLFDSATIMKQLPNFNGEYKYMTDGNNQRALDHHENLEQLLDHFTISVRWNDMKRYRVIDWPGKTFHAEQRENQSLYEIENLCTLNKMPLKSVDKHLELIALKHTYHPVKDYILSKPLVASGILDKFIKNIETTNDSLSHLLIKRWMLSAVASIFDVKGISAQGVLVIQGPQGFYKTAFIQSLLPDDIGGIKIGKTLDPYNKDDLINVNSFWIVELGELDSTFRKADLARLKAFITNNTEDIRFPYQSKFCRLQRRTVFAATVNELEFLADNTGNRRWWVISIDKPININHGLDMQQVWREAYEMWLDGERHYLNDIELALLNASNEDYEFTDPIVEKILKRFDWDGPKTQYLTCTEILQSIGLEFPNRSQCITLGMNLKKMNVVCGIGRQRYSYFMPAYSVDWYKI